jgi:hypothetical protein
MGFEREGGRFTLAKRSDLIIDVTVIKSLRKDIIEEFVNCFSSCSARRRRVSWPVGVGL